MHLAHPPPIPATDSMSNMSLPNNGRGKSVKNLLSTIEINFVWSSGNLEWKGNGRIVEQIWETIIKN